MQLKIDSTLENEPSINEDDDFMSLRDYSRRERNYAHDAKLMAKNARKQKPVRAYIKGLLKGLRRN